MALQEQLDQSLAKIAQSLAPIAESFASLLENSFALYGILGLIAATKLTGLIAQLTTIGVLNRRNAASAVASNAAFGGPIGVALATTAVIGAIALIDNQLSSIDDGIIDGSGGLVVSGPKGSISLNSSDTIVGNKDGIIAGTNLGGGGNNKELIGRIDKLIAATERGSTITMDGNLVGKSVANNTFGVG